MSILTQLSPQFDQQFFDNNGDPLVGGFVYTYAAGTTTPQAAYVDSTGNTPQTNPIVLDGNGRAPIWLGPLAYKFVLKDSNSVTILTVDNVSNIAPGFITTAMIADGAVTSPKIATGGVQTANIADQAVTSAKIANGAVGSTQIGALAILGSNIAEATITDDKLAGFGLSLNPSFIQFYTFTVMSANATAGAVYSNNGVNFTVMGTISSGSSLQCYSSGAPTSGATTLVLVSGTGDSTISVSASTSAGTYSWITPAQVFRAFLNASGGGGGGGGGGTSGGGQSTAGASGIATSFNGITVSYGGNGGGGNSNTTGGSINAGPNYADYYFGGAGANGTPANGSAGSPSQFFPGGAGGPLNTASGGGGGGASSFSAGGLGGDGNATNGTAGLLGSGGGGGGAASGGGAGAGGNGVKSSWSILSLTPGDTNTIVIGAGGGGGGGVQTSGGNGGDGFLVVYY